MTMDVKHNTRSYHEAQVSKYLCNLGSSVMISDSNRKLEYISTEIRRNRIDSERDFDEIKGMLQILREVIER